MKSFRWNFGWCEIGLNFRFGESKPIEIRKLDVAPRDARPELRRFLYSRVKAARVISRT